MMHMSTTLDPPPTASIDDLFATVEHGDLFDLTHAQVRTAIVDLERHRARVDATQNRLIAHFDTLGLAASDGYATTRAWLRQRTHMSGPTAARRVRTARQLRSMPIVTGEFEAGRLSFEQANAFANALNPRTEEAMTIDEQALVDLALGIQVDALQGELRGWKEAVDPDGPKPAAGHTSRHLALSQGLDGQWFGQFELNAADGAVIKSAIEQMSDWLWHHEKKSGLTDTGAERTAAQRRADALVELIRRGLTTLNDEYAPGHTPKSSLSLLITLEDLESGRSATTDAGDHVGGTGLERLGCDCVVQPIGWSVDGVPLSHGRKKRIPTPAQRRAAIAQYGGCFFPGCDAPASWADIHHLAHWDRDNGDTDQENLAPACAGTHHKLFHEGGWDTRIEPDGTITILKPDGTIFDPTPGWN